MNRVIPFQKRFRPRLKYPRAVAFYELRISSSDVLMIFEFGMN
jgi:hypothetical protein